MRRLIALGIFALGGVSVAADTPAELIIRLNRQMLRQGPPSSHKQSDANAGTRESKEKPPTTWIAHHRQPGSLKEPPETNDKLTDMGKQQKECRAARWVMEWNFVPQSV